MIRKAAFLLLLLLVLGIVITAVHGAPDTIGQPFVLKEELFASDMQGSAEFGTAVSLSRNGQVMVVGARYQDVSGHHNQGRAYVFKRNPDNSWTQLQTLTAPDGAANHEFGTAVAISNAPDYTIVVGAPTSASGTGSAYVFEYTGSGWDSGSKLTISEGDADNNDKRGTAVAITDNGTSIFVGAPGGGIGNPAKGAVFVIKASGGGWTHDQTLSQITSGLASMGKNILVNSSGSLLFVAGLDGNSGPIIDHGIVHVYQNSGATWNYDESIKASDTSSNNEFGLGMAIADDGKRLFIGAPGKNSGQAYLFMPNSGNWVEESIFTKPAGSLYSKFGQSVAMDSYGASVAIGAWLNGSGGIYYYERTGDNWNYKQTLKTPDNRQEHLGYAIDMSSNGDVLVGGARSANSGATMDSVGSVYTFVPGHQIFLPTIIK